MQPRRFIPSTTTVAVVVAIVIGVELAALGQQVDAAAKKINGSTIANNTVTGKQVKESSLGTVPNTSTASRATTAKTATTAITAEKLPALVWHPIATFLNGWSNYPLNARPAAYAVDANGIVHLQGTIAGPQAGLSLPAFTLPASITPPDADNEYFSVTAGGATVAVIELQGDNIEPIGGGSSSAVEAAGFESLEGITFSAR